MKVINRAVWLSLALLIFTFNSSFGAAALSLEVGATQEIDNWKENHLNFQATLWHQWDQMIFFGLSGGTQQYGEDYYYPALVSSLVRLPIGRTLLPYATGQWGYLFGPQPQFTWKLGGGLDLKLGSDSSILFSTGYQKFYEKKWVPQVYVNGGILLEF